MTRPAQRRTPVVVIVIATLLTGLLLAGCGGSTPQATTCSLASSDLGPFSPETTLGSSMTEDQARARMAQDNIIGWLAVTATGHWDQYWDVATAELGQSIHDDLTWLDVNGTIDGLYRAGDQFEFADVRVSRSFQGKIEHNDDALYLPLQDVGQVANLDATCSVTSLEFGDPRQDVLLDVLDATSSLG